MGWHAVVAVDFGDISDRAAQAAIDTVGDQGIVELVHVMPHIHEDAFAVEPVEPYARWVHSQLMALRERLVIRGGATVSCAAVPKARYDWAP